MDTNNLVNGFIFSMRNYITKIMRINLKLNLLHKNELSAQYIYITL